jgi:hypothetical protein
VPSSFLPHRRRGISGPIVRHERKVKKENAPGGFDRPTARGVCLSLIRPLDLPGRAPGVGPGKGQAQQQLR